MLNLPCSRVGHVYRRNVPYSYNKPFAVLINFKRVAEVWMDGSRSFCIIDEAILNSKMKVISRKG